MNVNEDKIKNIVKVVEAAVRAEFGTTDKPQTITSTQIDNPDDYIPRDFNQIFDNTKKKEIDSFDINAWTWLIKDTRKRSDKLDNVPYGYKILERLDECKNIKSFKKEYKSINKALCNVINRAIRKYNKTGNTNDVRVFRRHAENMSRGFLYLTVPSQYTVDNRPRFTVTNCVKVGDYLKKGWSINKNNKGWD